MKYYHELVEVSHLQPAKILHQEFKPTTYMNQHWHDEIEIVIPIKGHFTGHVNGSKKFINTNDLLIINTKNIHTLSFENNHQNVEVITLLLDYQQILTYDTQANQHYFDHTINTQDKEKIIQTILEIDQTYLQKEKFFEVRLHMLLHQLYWQLFKFTYKEKDSKSKLLTSIEIPTTKQIIDYIENHYQEHISLAILSKHLGFSSVYISRLFKQTCHLNISEYIQRVRLNHAYDDLVNSNLSITNIALENGFPNVKSFINTFKQYYELTPLQYRNKLKKDNN